MWQLAALLFPAIIAYIREQVVRRWSGVLGKEVGVGGGLKRLVQKLGKAWDREVATRPYTTLPNEREADEQSHVTVWETDLITYS